MLAILAVPFLFAGTIFPLTLTGARNASPGATARAVGMLYAVNTVGAIFGAVIAGFVIVPWLGSHATLMCVTLLMAILSVGCALASGSRKLAIGGFAGLAVVAAGLVAGPEWDQ